MQRVLKRLQSTKIEDDLELWALGGWSFALAAPLEDRRGRSAQGRRRRRCKLRTPPNTAQAAKDQRRRWRRGWERERCCCSGLEALPMSRRGKCCWAVAAAQMGGDGRDVGAARCERKPRKFGRRRLCEGCGLQNAAALQWEPSGAARLVAREPTRCDGSARRPLVPRWHRAQIGADERAAHQPGRHEMPC